MVKYCADYVDSRSLYGPVVSGDNMNSNHKRERRAPQCVVPSCALPFFFFFYETVTSCFKHHLFFCYFYCFFLNSIQETVQHTDDIHALNNRATHRNTKKYPRWLLLWRPLNIHRTKDDINGPSPFCWTSDKGSSSL